jgi:hypothetical protein
MGVEAAMIGKRILLESSVYYSKLTFVENASSKSDYFRMISSAVDLPNPQFQTEAQREEAELCFFLASVNQIFTDFTPIPGDFEKWVGRDLDQISMEPTTQDVMDSFELAIPTCVLRAQRLFAPIAEASHGPRSQPPGSSSDTYRIFRAFKNALNKIYSKIEA